MWKAACEKCGDVIGQAMQALRWGGEAFPTRIPGSIRHSLRSRLFRQHPTFDAEQVFANVSGAVLSTAH
jgi:hypothetical protein